MAIDDMDLARAISCCVGSLGRRRGRRHCQCSSLRLCDFPGHISKDVRGEMSTPGVDQPQLELPIGVKIVELLTCPVQRDDASRGLDNHGAFRLVLKFRAHGAIAEIFEFTRGGFGAVQSVKASQKLDRRPLGQRPSRIWPATEDIESDNNV